MEYLVHLSQDLHTPGNNIRLQVRAQVPGPHVVRELTEWHPNHMKERECREDFTAPHGPHQLSKTATGFSLNVQSFCLHPSHKDKMPVREDTALEPKAWALDTGQLPSFSSMEEE